MIENEHLEILSKVAVVFSDEDDAARMRDATTVDELYDVLESVND